ncbi:hypothetical protein [Nonomuraea sp. B1E8]|uniref:hypothetical protein n=1 Tax=unclassified Nonomuraea TaxID=2593643 RepID=UPI00325D1450
MTPMVLSSQTSPSRAGFKVKAGSSIGIQRGSTSRHWQNFGQQAWTAVPITRLGLAVGSPAARRRSRHWNFIASAPSMAASLEPPVEQPTLEPFGSPHR